jgi:hypothetical protein
LDELIQRELPFKFKLGQWQRNAPNFAYSNAFKRVNQGLGLGNWKQAAVAHTPAPAAAADEGQGWQRRWRCHLPTFITSTSSSRSRSSPGVIINFQKNVPTKSSMVVHRIDE